MNESQGWFSKAMREWRGNTLITDLLQCVYIRHVEGIWYLHSAQYRLIYAYRFRHSGKLKELPKIRLNNEQYSRK